MSQAIEYIVGLITAVLLGLAVKPLLNIAAPRPPLPGGLTEEVWDNIVERSHSGAWIGFLERVISLISFWIAQYTIIGAWLGFKVVAKWEVWKNIVRVPDNLEGVTPLEWYQARNAMGGWVFGRFVVGTLMNILIGAVAAYVGLHSSELIKSLNAK